MLHVNKGRLYATCFSHLAEGEKLYRSRRNKLCLLRAAAHLHLPNRTLQQDADPLSVSGPYLHSQCALRNVSSFLGTVVTVSGLFAESISPVVTVLGARPVDDGAGSGSLCVLAAAVMTHSAPVLPADPL